MIAAVKAVDIDLIDHSAFRPVRRVEPRRNAKIIAALYIRRHAQAVIITDLLALHYLEKIMHWLFPDFDLILIIIKQLVGVCLYHPVFLCIPAFDIKNLQGFVFSSSEPNNHQIPGVRLCRYPVILSLVCK